MLCATAQAADTSGEWPGGTFREIAFPPPEGIGPERPAADLDLPTTPPDDPQVGDSWLWWLWVHEGMPHFEQRVCTVRGKTDHGYVVVDDSEWNFRIFQADVDQILERWENSSLGDDPDMGIYDINSTYFGLPPDELDDDPRIYLMWFDFGIPSDGFFFWFDEFPDGTNPPYRSNECEVLYLNTANGQSPSGEYMISVAAHEFEHMIHWKYDSNEDLWVDEGMAELAMYFYGRPDVISGFNALPDNPLTEWNGNWPDYIKTYLWSLYFYERYGGHEAVYAVVHEAQNSIYGYETVLDAFGYSENVADVFADWTVANFLDDPTLEDGRFGYLGDDLPPFNVMGTYTSYPVADQPRTVGHWATDYYRFQDFDGFTAVELGFDGSDNNVFAVWGLALYGGGETGIYRMTIDPGTQSGTLAVPGLHHADDEVILVVASVSSYGAMNYVFNAAAGSADVPDVADGVGDKGRTAPLHLSLRSAPNPSPGHTTLSMAWNGSAAVAPAVGVYDAQGRLVRTLLAAGTPLDRAAIDRGAAGAGGQLVLTWDGRLATGAAAPPGVYFARARLGAASSEQTILLIR